MMADCPVWGMEVDADDPPEQVEYEGTMDVFCEGRGCTETFEANPERYA
ncbi:YHS domain-containing protein [Haladaptatus caseinilyticus]|nr:YHS domain-containing protein [Haladaptatus caseinilyticus]